MREKQSSGARSKVLVRILVLTAQDLLELLDPKSLVDAIAQAFKKYSKGETVTPPRTVFYVEGNWWGIMQSYVPGEGVGVKVVNIIPSNRERGLPTIQALVSLYDPVTGSPQAIMEGGVLTALRTAAASALSVKLLAPKEKGAVAVIGTGYQARFQLRFIKEYYRPSQVRIYDIRREAMEEYKRFVEEELGLEVYMAKDHRDCIKGARIVVEASTTKDPVIYGDVLEPPVHIVSIGAHTPTARALDDEAIEKVDLIVVDSRKAVMEEAGDIRIPVQKGLIKMEDLVELGELVEKGLDERPAITLFKSVGLAIQDACAAGLAYKKALEKGLGKWISI